MSSTVNPGMTNEELVDKMTELVARVEAVAAQGGAIDLLSSRMDAIDGGSVGGMGSTINEINAKVNDIASAHNALVEAVKSDRSRNEQYLESIRNTGCRVVTGYKSFKNKKKRTIKGGKVTQFAWTDKNHPYNEGWRPCGVSFVRTGSRHVVVTRFDVTRDGNNFVSTVRLTLRDASHANVSLAAGDVKVRVRYMQVKTIKGNQIAEVDYGEIDDEVIVEEDD